MVTETREQMVERALAEYESPLVGYAYGFVKDLERARDIVQDTFIRLCQQDVAKVRDGLKNWLFTVCRNRALDVLRKESRLTALDEQKLLSRAAPGVGPDGVLDQSERMASVMACLSRLSENQRTVILMKFRDGLSYQEICERTGLGSGNVGFLIHTGLKRLREWLPSDLMDSTPGNR
ncbi:MAG: sigma-70 family RNA polymerase sigma factor [Verrucomicrobia bacterium]|nr:MAG: sigma-70 family RNA polymerase sigma factor [Verrucomicrobiota bacterium]TAE89418.1 MAG: sigma-70 family RNA polymerase sigma factor [Verrucomicrobiota bacterium]TAF28082.1 MAG: sigma-70 family RNA polymerase sigma factor [Verrucomicrobiota bacterium]TAF42928.1 MAG: sigma-70 family RNA polymerase sigma factor [Verrucomicrobiota bacterium]